MYALGGHVPLSYDDMDMASDMTLKDMGKEKRGNTGKGMQCGWLYLSAQI